MNVRTNLRTWRKTAHYIVQVGLRGNETNHHIYAEIKAIVVDTMSEVLLVGELAKFVANDTLFVIADGKNAQDSVAKAVEMFRQNKMITNNVQKNERNNHENSERNTQRF